LGIPKASLEQLDSPECQRHADPHAIHGEVKQKYGWPRMHKELVTRGIRVGRERVRRLMKQHDIQARTKPKLVLTTDSKHSLPIAPDLVQRQFNPQMPNQL
jgi:putative transposase